MIATTSGSLPWPANYLKINRSVTTESYQDNGHKVQQENFQCSNDQVSLSCSAESVTTYSRSLFLESTIGDGYDLLRGLVLNIFTDQGIDYIIAADQAAIDIRTLTPEKAQEFIAADGYFGVEKTSERIVKFAIGMAGGDSARLDAICQGVDDCFQQAQDAFGGRLPDISYNTYERIMQKLDDWAGIETTNNHPESQTQVKS